MDGAGRLAEKLRPQTDLKAAAIGAVVLLREYLGFGRAPAKAVKRPVIDRDPPLRLIAWIERHVPRRAGLIATLSLLAASAGFGIVRGGHYDDFVTAVSDTRNAFANSMGFRITTVAINGRRQLSQDEILAIGGVNGRSSLLFLDAAALREKLKSNPWIADATVIKYYPGGLQIDIVERSAFALWQQNGRLSVIADDGAVLEPYVTRRFVSLPLVVGRAPRLVPAISSRCWRATRRSIPSPLPRSMSASGAGTCAPKTASTFACRRAMSAMRSPP